MSWVYISDEQGRKIDAICEKYRTEPAYRDADCPDCPIREVCRMELPKGTDEKSVSEHTRLFETALAEAANRI